MTLKASDERVIELVGPIDLTTVPTLLAHSRVALGESGRDVAVDLSRASFIDAAGLGGVIQLRNAVLAAGRNFRLIGVRPAQARVFVLAGLAALLPLPE